MGLSRVHQPDDFSAGDASPKVERPPGTFRKQLAEDVANSASFVPSDKLEVELPDK